MKEIVSRDYMKATDEKTCKNRDMTSYLLMEEAGMALAKACDKRILKPAQKTSVLFIAGSGHNGGDALIMAEHLKEHYNVFVAVVGNIENMHPDVKQVYNRLKSQIDLHAIQDKADLTQLPLTDVIVDGLFGIGISRPIKGLFHDVIQWINHSTAKVVSVDIPSGLDANSGHPWGISVKADDTLVVQALKHGHIMYQGRDYCGKKHIVDVGIVIEDNNDCIRELNDYHQLLKNRLAYSNKYDYGSLAIFGGNIGMLGAPHLTAYAALRSGIGLCSLYVREHVYSQVTMGYPELMVSPIVELKTCLTKKDILVFGPGLGKDDPSQVETLKKLINHPAPLIIDADGLYYFNKIKDNISINKPIIITPHSGEMSQFFDVNTLVFESNWEHYLNQFTAKYPVTVLLKGPTMVIANQEKKHFVRDGGAELASAGSGDVLCGIIAGLIPRFDDVFDATVLAALVLAHAGQIAKSHLGEDSVLATDIINALPKVLESLKSDSDNV